MRQAAVVMATVLLQAANTDQPIARGVLPRQPQATDPFRYQDPRKN